MVKQPILTELEHFINGVSNFYTLPPNALVKLSQCSLNLLENLPASRDAVFEYFALIFDTSVSNYVQTIEVSAIPILLNCQPDRVLRHVFLYRRSRMHRIPTTNR